MLPKRAMGAKELKKKVISAELALYPSKSSSYDRL